MAESTAYARRGFTGGAVQTTLASGITAGATSMDLVDASTWATADDNGPFRITITDGTTEEEVEATTVSGNTISSMTRGVGGTSAAAWASGVTVKLTSSVRDYDEANKWVNELSGAATAANVALVADAANSLAGVSFAASRVMARLASGDLKAATPAEIVTLLQGTELAGYIFATVANDSAYVATGEGTTSATFTDLATAGPAVTVTTGTKALVIIAGQIQNDTISQQPQMGFAVSGATTLAADATRALTLYMATANVHIEASYAYIVEGLTAGSNTFTAKYAATGGTATFQERRISVVNMGS